MVFTRSFNHIFVIRTVSLWTSAKAYDDAQMTDADIDAMTEAQAKAALKAVLATIANEIAEALKKVGNPDVSSFGQSLWSGKAACGFEIRAVVKAHAR